MTDNENPLIIPTWGELPDAVRGKWRARIDELLPAPPLLSELSGLGLTVKEFDARALTGKVGYDAVLGARLLAVANSAKFGLSQPMTSIRRAMVHMGFNLVKTVIVGYLMESGFDKGGPIPDAHRRFVHGWTAGASVIAFRWGQKAELADPSTAGTVALLSRVGSLMMGSAKPSPGEEYRLMDSDVARLRYELATWSVASPVLSSELIRSWGLPGVVADMCAKAADPIVSCCPPDPIDPYPRVLTVVAGSLAVADQYLRGKDTDTVLTALKENPGYNYLIFNLKAHRLLDALEETWHSTRVQRELASVTE